VQKKAGLRFFLRGVVRKTEGGYVVSTTGEQGSGILKSMVLANGIIVLPEEVAKVPRGAAVTVQVLDDSL
jgi:molybdopterin molybdotransferase